MRRWRGVAVWALILAAVAVLAAAGSWAMTVDPDDPRPRYPLLVHEGQPMTTKTPVNEIAERVLKSHGWALGPEFWQRVTSDPFVFQLVAVIEREAVKTDELRSATRDLITARAKKAEAVRNAYPLPFYEAAADGEREAESRLRSLVGVEDTTEATPDA